ncbi:MAG: L-histidine N(alpha)-methyltransferase [candidate division KSB1 bacterium]|nr:L-histidine N(alpha)-methyltransferase [candidate division KSB1 bacterium]MDZ7365215.1 L-histidine N(alpha)-methyltransferase [candidate division KSB1 bacterium]MDZ7407272.1 L-histidine N(alpha)-methyltransferase [candidate division KSB1 bacterium]
MHCKAALDARLQIEVETITEAAPSFAKDVLAGLSAKPKTLPPMYFYDAAGSKLFEKICALPEYYLTRTERAILERHAPEIVARANGEMALVELGSGSSTKTRLLIEALIARQNTLHYFPIDISPTILAHSAKQLLHHYPELLVTAYVADYNTGFRRIAAEHFTQKLVVFLGSSLGNFEPQQANRLLRNIRRQLNEDDFFLLGTDLQKAPRLLHAAYNDAQGVTAAFNLNVLRRINRELAGQFNLDLFEHAAFYHAAQSRVEMHLRSTVEQEVYIGRLDRSFHFAKGETIHTENSHKYNLEQIKKICAHTGFRLVQRWQDNRGYFSLNLLAPA